MVTFKDVEKKAKDELSVTEGIIKQISAIENNHGSDFRESCQSLRRLLQMQYRSDNQWFKLCSNLLRDTIKNTNSMQCNDELHIILRKLLVIEMERRDTEKGLIDNFLNLFPYSEKSAQTQFLRQNKGILKAMGLKKDVDRCLKNIQILTELGPKIKGKECSAATRKFMEFRQASSKFKEYMDGRECKFAIFGSLVTGISSPQSNTPNSPTDQGRISDVDLTVVIPKDILQLFKSQTIIKKLIFWKQGLITHIGPIKESSAAKLGPFSDFFKYMKNLSFAGRTDRTISLMIVETNFFATKLRTEPHIVLFLQ
jgi:hypothetical protein